jgi:PadR family transcriptional regulator, regulatory protein PadR
VTGGSVGTDDEGFHEPSLHHSRCHDYDIELRRMLRDFLLGFVKVRILHHASREPVYGVWFIEELARHNYHLSPGTLYPLLHNLEAAGYLRREDRVVEGKVRKYYEITPLGEEALAEARSKIQELVEEVMEPAVRPAAARRRRRT